jgi:hypothetical protein
MILPPHVQGIMNDVPPGDAKPNDAKPATDDNTPDQ